jgi:hypothetical protein
MEDDMRGSSIGLGILLLGATFNSASAETALTSSIVTPAPLSQMTEPGERIAGARVTDPDGNMIGAVQKVELRDGKPVRIAIALLVSENTVTLDASTLRYDAGSNLIAASQGAAQLLAQPKN